MQLYFIKLRNGDDLVSIVNIKEDTLELTKPLRIASIVQQGTSQHILIEWISTPLTKSDGVYTIAKSEVLVMVLASDMVQTTYSTVHKQLDEIRERQTTTVMYNTMDDQITTIDNDEEMSDNEDDEDPLDFDEMLRKFAGMQQPKGRLN